MFFSHLPIPSWSDFSQASLVVIFELRQERFKSAFQEAVKIQSLEYDDILGRILVSTA